MNSKRLGASSVGIIGVIAVVAIVGFLIAYFGSDVFRTKVDANVTQFSKWTPENIAKDPINYLNFCEAEAKKAIEKCKASEIAIAQKKAKIEQMKTDAENKSNVGTKAIDELKTLYKDADEKSAFPITWRTTTLEKETAKRQIVKLAGQVKTNDAMLKKLAAAVTQLEVQKNKLADAKESAKDQLVKIDANREMLKVQQITDDLKNNLVEMKGALETSIVGIENSEPGSLSLDDLAAQSETTVSDDDFNKIMAE